MGGAILADELSSKTSDLLLVESGEEKETPLNLSLSLSRDLFLASRSGMGGTAALSAGRVQRINSKTLEHLGINLENEYQLLENEGGVYEVPESDYGERTKRLFEAAKKLELNSKPIPKFKEYPGFFLERAKQRKIDILTGTAVKQVLHKESRVSGILIKDNSGTREIASELVILCAGTLGTSVLLLNSGIEESINNVSMGIFQSVYGEVKDSGFPPEIPGPVSIAADEVPNLIITPFLPPDLPFVDPGSTLCLTNWLRDQNNGNIFKNGSFDKLITDADYLRLDQAVEISSKILLKAGVERIYISFPLIAFAPVGSAMISTSVDANCETRIKNLFIGDASIIPSDSGPFPLFMIGALAKRLANLIALKHL